MADIKYPENHCTGEVASQGREGHLKIWFQHKVNFHCGLASVIFGIVESSVRGRLEIRQVKIKYHQNYK